MEALSRVYFGNTVLSYLTAAAILAGGLIVVSFLKWLLVRKLTPIVQKSASQIDDVALELVARTLLPALMFGVLYLSLNSLHLNPGLEKLLRVAGVMLFTFLAVRVLMAAISILIFQFWIPRQANKDILEQQIRGLFPAAYVVVWALAIVFMLDNLGFKVSTVLAGLGVGGVALALASQAVLADLFSYFAILFDHPFAIGDFIVVGDQLGTIEHIGIKTTRIRSLDGEQVIFGNKDLTGSRIQNYKRMQTRRIVFSFSVGYQTTVAQLRAMPALIKQIILSQSLTAFDRAHFKNYDPSGLVFEVVYIVQTADFNKYMDIQHEINLRLKEELENQKIEFSHPLQTIKFNPSDLSSEIRQSV